jgi:hypothetical protein
VDICKEEQVSKANQPEGQKGDFMRRVFLQVVLYFIPFSTPHYILEREFFLDLPLF